MLGRHEKRAIAVIDPVSAPVRHRRKIDMTTHPRVHADMDRQLR